MSLKSFAKKHWEKALLLAVISGFFLISKSGAFTAVYNEPLVNETGLAYNNTYTLNVNGYKGDYLSFQVTYASQTLPATYTFTDGSQSTATITVSQAGSAVALTTSTASDFLTVLTTTSLTGSVVTVAGVPLTEGIHWTADTTASTWTAISIKNAVNSYVPNVAASTGVAASSLGVGLGRAVTIFTTSTFGGASANNMTMVSNNSSITVNAANFTGGNDNGCFSINNVLLCANRDFGVGSSSATTAFNIMNAINANTTLSAVVTATAPVNCGAAASPSAATCGIVRSTSVIEGTVANYAMFTSTKSALVLAGNTSSTTYVSSGTMNMFGGTNPAYSLNGTQITLPAHGMSNGTMVSFSTSSSVGISGLKFGTTYFVNVVDANTIALSSRSVDAVSGINFNQLNSSTTKVTGNSFQLQTSTWVASATWKYQASNDGTVFTDLTTPTPFATGVAGNPGSYVFPSTSTVNDIGLYDFSYFRVNVTAPTTGQILLKVVPNLKTAK